MAPGWSPNLPPDEVGAWGYGIAVCPRFVSRADLGSPWGGGIYFIHIPYRGGGVVYVTFGVYERWPT